MYNIMHITSLVFSTIFLDQPFLFADNSLGMSAVSWLVFSQIQGTQNLKIGLCSLNPMKMSLEQTEKDTERCKEVHAKMETEFGVVPL